MEELQFQIVLDRNVGSKVSGVLAFGDFEPGETGAIIYSTDDLVAFYRDLILGRPFPLVLVARGVDNLGLLTAIVLFLHRDLAVHPSTPGFVSAVTLCDALGVAGYAHIDSDLARFLRFVVQTLQSTKGADVQQGLTLVVGWIRDYLLTGSLPALPPSLPEPRIIDRGTNGFVFASVAHPDLDLGWEDLFRRGFLRGVLLQQVPNDRWRVLCARKSLYLSWDLSSVAAALNDAEATLSEPSEWVAEGLWLRGPERGTLILPSVLLKLLLRA